jgi:hypothetical protein
VARSQGWRAGGVGQGNGDCQDDIAAIRGVDGFDRTVTRYAPCISPRDLLALCTLRRISG